MHKLTHVSGPSGCGKSSLIYHTLFQESKRRLLNSYPSFIRFFQSKRPTTPNVQSISPVMPTFALKQYNPVMQSRDKVSDQLLITENLAKLYFLEARPVCVEHDEFLEAGSVLSKVSTILEKFNEDDVIHCLVSGLDYKRLFSDDAKAVRSLKNNEMVDFDESDYLWEVFRFKKKGLTKKQDDFVHLARKAREVSFFVKGDLINCSLSLEPSCPKCSREQSVKKTLSLFSPFNSHGACSFCNGHGQILEIDPEKFLDFNKTLSENLDPFQFKRIKKYNAPFKQAVLSKKFLRTRPLKEIDGFMDFFMNGDGKYPGLKGVFDKLEAKKYMPAVRIYIRSKQMETVCANCHNSRLNQFVREYRLGKNIAKIDECLNMTIQALYQEILKYESYDKSELAQTTYSTLLDTLKRSIKLGIGHLKLSRQTKTLSSGEYQKTQILKYFSFKASDSLFILDEPSLALSVEEKSELVNLIHEVIKENNTVIVVDHSPVLASMADHHVVLGPKGGVNGGQIVFEGNTSEAMKLSHFNQKVEVPKVCKLWKKSKDALVFKNLYINDRKVLSEMRIPQCGFVSMKGDSGSGKSSLAKLLYNTIKADHELKTFATYKSLESFHKIENVHYIDSHQLKANARSTIGSVTTLAQVVRKYFVKEIGDNSILEGHFNPSSELGQCPECQGKGIITVDMQYLEDVSVTCSLCEGSKLRQPYDQMEVGGLRISDLMNAPVSETLERMKLTPKFRKIRDYLHMLHLDHLSLERSLVELSGGEKQRVHLMLELMNISTPSLIIIENLSFGLSYPEVSDILEFLCGFCQKGSHSLFLVDQVPFIHDWAHQSYEVKSI